MNNIKEFYKTKEEIITWLDTYNIKDYTLIQDSEYGFVVDVKDNVDLNNSNLYSISVKFNKVGGNFDCSNNKLSSLRFAPEDIIGSFYCQGNNLLDLEYCPKIINGTLAYDINVKLLFIPEFIGFVILPLKDGVKTEMTIFSELQEESLRQNKEKLNKEMMELMLINNMNTRKIKI